MGDKFVKAAWMPDIVVSTHTTVADPFAAVLVTTPTAKANATGIIKKKGYGQMVTTMWATTNDLTVEYAVSQDGTNFLVKDAAILVVVGTPKEASISDKYNYIRLRVKPTAAGVNGTLLAHTNGSSF